MEFKKKNNRYSKFDTIPFLHELSKISYKIDGENNKIKIFGKKFVNKYKGKCIIIYRDKIYELMKYFSMEEVEMNKRKNL